MKNIAVYGAGSWGTALACHIARKNGKCTLIARDKNVIEDIKNNRLNRKYLGGNILEKNIIPNCNVQELRDQEIIIIALPSASIRQAIEIIKNIINPNSILLVATKGLLGEPVMMISNYLNQILPNPIAFISGPNFAVEVVNNLQTYTSIAAESLKLAENLNQILSTENFTISPCDDIVSIQLAGAIKNVIAIQSGIYQAKIQQNLLGENAKAALITQGLQEIGKMAEFFGGRSATLQEMGVVGDLVLTCASLKSRNARFGFELARAKNTKQFIQNYNILVEGLNQAKLLEQWLIEFDLDLPLLSSIINTLKV